MTREEHLEFCRRCMNRKFDAANGIVCSLTGEIASFEKDCESFKMDPSVIIPVNSETILDAREIKSKLPSEIYDKLRQQQDLPKAIAAGVFVAILCSVIWSCNSTLDDSYIQRPCNPSRCGRRSFHETCRQRDRYIIRDKRCCHFFVRVFARKFSCYYRIHRKRKRVGIFRNVDRLRLFIPPGRDDQRHLLLSIWCSIS